MPRITVPRDNPLARATAVTPPNPMASASAAATKRRVRSSKTRERTSNLYAKPPASGIAASIEHFRSKCSIYFVTAPKRQELSATNRGDSSFSFGFHPFTLHNSLYTIYYSDSRLAIRDSLEETWDRPSSRKSLKLTWRKGQIDRCAPAISSLFARTM